MANIIDHGIIDDISPIWDFPSVLNRDLSITKKDYHKVYESNSPAGGSLENSDEFNFVTHNENIWLLISDSYLKIKFQVTKEDDSNYVWADTAAVGAAAAINADDVNLTDNGFNIFEKGRYYIENEEIEKIDHVGVSSLMTVLQKYNNDKLKASKYQQLLFLNKDNDRQTYMRQCQGEIQLMLPLSTIFPFCQQIDHVFRGVRHQIQFTLTSSNQLLRRVAAVDAGIIKIKSCVWMIPYVEPSLEIMSKLESQLAKNPSYPIHWKACSVIKNQPPKNQEIRYRLNSNTHKLDRILIMLQQLRKTNSQLHASTNFDSMNVESIFVEVNGMRFPETPLKVSFTNRDVFELYDSFVEVSNYQNIIDVEEFRTKYPIWSIDLTKCKPELYENSSVPDIVVNIKFKNIPTIDYIVWTVVYNIRELTLNCENKRMRVIR